MGRSSTDGAASARVHGARLAVAAVLLVAAWLPAPARAGADTLDQACTTAAQDVAWPITGAAGSGWTLTQTFTPTASTLGAVDILYFNDNGTAAHTLTGRLRQGGTSGAVVATTQAQALTGQVGPMWVRFAFATPQSVTPGQPYAFQVSASAPPDSVLWSQCATDDAGGSAYSSTHGVFTNLNVDLGFRAISSSAAPSVSIGDASVLEGDTGTRTLMFPVTLSRTGTNPVTVSYTIAGVTATGGTTNAPGVDFDDRGGATGTVTFSAPQAGEKIATLQYVSVAVFSDTTLEPNETLAVTLSSPSAGYRLARDTGIGTILNDDGISGGTTIGVGDGTVVRGQSGNQKLQIPVTLSRRVPGGVALVYTVTPLTGRFSTASGGGDYGGNTNGVLKFSGTAITHTVTVPVWPDPNPSAAPRTFLVTLSDINNPAVFASRSVGTGTILPVPSTANLPGLARAVAVQVDTACTATDPITGSQPGSRIEVTWSAPTTGDAPTSYTVTTTVTYPSHVSATTTLSVPAGQTTTGPQCYPVGSHIQTAVAPSNSAGTTATATPSGVALTIVPPTDLSWTSPASISDDVPATFASTSPCPTTFADGTPVNGVELVQVTVHSAGATPHYLTPATPNWSITTTPAFGFQDLGATVVAACYQVNPQTQASVLVAQYNTHAIAVNP